MDSAKRLIRLMIGLTLLLFIVLMIPFLFHCAEAETIIVAKDGNGEYDNIQDAIDNATEGETIRVWEGTYYENVRVDKRVNLLGNGSEVTTVDGGGSGDVVRITSNWVNISGFLVTNGSEGISLEESSDCTISNNTCSSNEWGGINLDDTSNACTIENNTCKNNSDGIYLFYSNPCIINNNIWEKNSRGIVIEGSVDCIINNNKISENAKGIYLEGPYERITIHDNIIMGNTGVGIGASDNAIDATNNWWGHSSGPFHSSKNPDGKGDNVTGDVDFDPWQTDDPLKTKFVDDDASDGGDGSKEHPYNKIQHAIDNATEGATIRVWEGTYYENVVVDKRVDLIGNGSKETTIDGGGNGNVVDITASGVSMSRFRVINGSQGINLISSTGSTITNNTCSENNNRGISVRDDSKDCTITNNLCENNYGGINIYSEGCSIKNNIGKNNRGSGIVIGQTKNCIIENNLLENNDNGIDLEAEDCTFTNNTCIKNNRGIFLQVTDNNTFEFNTITENLVGIESDWEHRSIAHYNIIYNNIDYGIRASMDINATDNWWGHETGPFHPTKNPNGKGDNVTDNVEFDPWLTEDPTIIIVDDDAPDGGDGSKEHPYNKIQHAIYNAMEGDTIKVWEGTYYENVVVDKSVSLVGNGSEEVTIDGGGSGSVVIIEEDGVVISGFKITNSDDKYGREAGIEVNSNNVIISTNNCSGNKGHGIHLIGSNTVTITSNDFLGNNAHGIKIDSNSNDVIISNNNCSHNDENGISIEGLEVSNITIIDNNCSLNEKDGIFSMSSKHLEICNNTLYDNKQTGINGKGNITKNICIANHQGIWAVESMVKENICIDNYYGIYISGSFSTIENNTCEYNDYGIRGSGSNNTFVYNKVVNNEKGGLNIGSASYCECINNEIQFNGGDGIVAGPYCNFTENTCSFNGENGINAGSHCNFLDNNCSNNTDSGIREDGYSTVSINRCINNGFLGIIVKSNSTVIHNTCTNNGYGIMAFSHCQIDANYLSQSEHADFRIWEGNNKITNNTCNSNSSFGLMIMYGSNNNKIFNNSIIDCISSIILYDSQHNTLRDNEMGRGGIFLSGDNLEHWNTHDIDETNTVGGKPVHYYKNSTDTPILPDPGQIIMANCSLMTVENHDLSHRKAGILMGFCSNISILNNDFISNDYGIYLYSSYNNTISNNNCSSNNEGGMYLDSCNDNIITHNTCTLNGKTGIQLVKSSSNTLSNNICISHSRFGIFLWKSCEHNEISDNILMHNDRHGIYLWDYCSYNTITNNTISFNTEGIYVIRYSKNNIAHDNQINDNSNYGIDASGNNGNIIDATNNWWGDPSGPYHSDDNPGGLGDNVSDDVQFDPWITEPVNQPPTADAGNDQTVYTNEDVQFVGTGKDPDGTIEKFEWDFDGDSSYDWDSESTGETTYSYPLKGTYHAVLRVTDDKGTTATDNCKIIVNDNIKPTIMITSHANNSEISGTVTIMGTAADEDNTIEKVEISIDDGDWEIVTGTETWTFEWDTKDSEDGEYKIRVRAFDGMNYSDLITWNLIVDNVPDNTRPTISITTPANNTTVTGTVMINGTASDPDGNKTIEKVEVSINSGAWATATGTTSWTFEWEITTLENGEYSLKFRAFDGEDFSEIMELVLNVQKPAPVDEKPTVTITYPTDGEKVSGTVIIKGNASNEDGDEAIEKVEVSVNDGAWATAAGTTSWQFEWDTNDVDNGEYTIKVRSFDGTNYSEIVSITITVENKEDGGEGSEENFLFEQIGPLPLIGYIGILLVVVVVGIVGAKKKRGRSKEGKVPGSKTPTLPPSGQSPPPVQPAAPIPLAGSPQQYVQQPTQQYTAQTYSSQPSPPQVTGTTWTCPKCGYQLEQQFQFCMSCGFKRNG